MRRKNSFFYITEREAAEFSVFKKPTKTAREMADTPHDLSRNGDLAITKNGDVYVWDVRFNHWAPWK